MSDDSNSHVQQLAHDIRHCLFTIRTGILLIRETYGLSDDTHDLFATIEKDQKQLAGLVEELVNTARKQSAGSQSR